MLKTYANLYKLEGASVSRASLGFVKAMLVASFPAVPMIIIGETFGIPNGIPVPIYVTIMLLSIAATLSLLFLRLPNRLYARDRYLDEWELDVKRRSMTFAYQFMVWGTSAVVMAGVLLDSFIGFETIGFTGGAFVWPFIMILLLGYYLQQLHALSLIRPYEDDEAGAAEPRKGSIVLAAGALGLLAILFSVLPALIQSARVASLSQTAVAECEARGSSVAWVNTEIEPGYGCQDDR